MTKFNPEFHTTVYEDHFMQSFWYEEEGVVTIYQVEKDTNEGGFVCLEVKDLREILKRVTELSQLRKSYSQMADEYIDNLIEKGLDKCDDFCTAMIYLLNFAQYLDDRADLIETCKE